MERFKRIFSLVIISVCIAVSVCLVQLNNYFKSMLNLDNKMQNYATYSIQHESNPLDKDIQYFIDLYNDLIPDQYDEYEYYEVYLQYLENNINNLKFYSAETNELTDSCFDVRSIQISENVIQDFNINVSEGSLFDQSDYIYEEGEAIPILMGDAYSSIYNVGDIFALNYLFDEYKFKVNGFIETDSRIELAGKKILLDTYIIMPSFEIGKNVPITNGLKIHYANKTSGIIKMDKNKVDIFYSTIKPLLSNTNAGKYSWIVEPMELYFKDVFGISIATFKGMIYFICLIMFIITGLMVNRLAKSKIENNTCLNAVVDGILLFIISSLFYIFINFIYIIIFGITIMKNICFVIIGLVSICVMILTYLRFCFYHNK